jgi:Protein of unknown function (DUF4232)
MSTTSSVRAALVLAGLVGLAGSAALAGCGTASAPVAAVSPRSSPSSQSSQSPPSSGAVAVSGGAGSTPAEGGPAGTTGPTGPTSPNACPPSGLRISTGGDDAAMGLRVTDLQVTNCGRRTHRLKGYPDLRFLDEDHEPMAIDVRHGSIVTGLDDPGPKIVVLKPGRSAFSVMSWRNTTLADGTSALTSTYASVAVKGEPALVLPFTADTGTTRLVKITAWQPATRRD